MAYKDVSYEVKGQLHGVSYTVDISGATGWTPVIGRNNNNNLLKDSCKDCLLMLSNTMKTNTTLALILVAIKI